MTVLCGCSCHSGRVVFVLPLTKHCKEGRHTACSPRLRPGVGGEGGS